VPHPHPPAVLGTLPRVPAQRPPVPAPAGAGALHPARPPGLRHPPRAADGGSSAAGPGRSQPLPPGLDQLARPDPERRRGHPRQPPVSRMKEMMTVDLQQLIRTLDATCRRDLEQAATRCVARAGAQVLVEDLLLALLERDDSLLQRALQDAGVAAGERAATRQPHGERQETRNPVFSAGRGQWRRAALGRGDSLLQRALQGAGVAAGELAASLPPHGERQETRNPVFSAGLVQWLQDALMLATLELGQRHIDQAALLLALLHNPLRHAGTRYQPLLARLDVERLRDFA